VAAGQWQVRSREPQLRTWNVPLTRAAGTLLRRAFYDIAHIVPLSTGGQSARHNRLPNFFFTDEIQHPKDSLPLVR